MLATLQMHAKNKGMWPYGKIRGLLPWMIKTHFLKSLSNQKLRGPIQKRGTSLQFLIVEGSKLKVLKLRGVKDISMIVERLSK